MELSKPVLDGIVIASDVKAVSDLSYSQIINEIFSIISTEKMSKIPSFDDRGKLAQAGLLTLLLEAAKHDCESNLISSVLEDCKMEQNRVTQFLKRYEENKLIIQEELSKIGQTTNHIIDVDWRQDYIIKNNYCDKIGQCCYILSLKSLVLKTSSVEEITFGCTIDQLQDLVFKLKDAAKCVERNSLH